MSEFEKSLDQQFDRCEEVVDDLMKGRLGISKSSQRNGMLSDCLQSLQSLSKAVDGLSLFSVNDAIDELPTSSLRFLLVPAYLATIFQEIGVEMDKRGAYLRASKAHYREFLQTLSIFGLINFQLPWLDEDERKLDDNQQQKEGTNARNQLSSKSFEDANAHRRKTISRIQQLEQLEKTVEQLKKEKQRNDDEAAQRELILTLLHLWSIRSIKELDMIEEELKMVALYEKRNSHPSILGDSASTSNDFKHAEPVRLKPFIIARSEAQKRVFGLGYPSVPTKTVDEWYDEMQKSGTFGKGAMPSTFTINQRETEKDEEVKEEEEERERQAQIQRDEWKDMNRRGCGNTYNKG